MRIDLNVDIGEGFPYDAALLELATSVNVCAGAHAGSTLLTLETIERARAFGLAVGIHPGYPDRDGFGRRPLAETGLDIMETKASLVTQCLAGKVEGARYVKPHGAFYNESAEGGPAGEWLLACLRASGLPVLGLEGSAHPVLAEQAGVAFVAEGFADRGYSSTQRLLPRSAPGAILSPTEAAEQALSLAGRVSSICVHGDGPDCLETLRRVRDALSNSGFRVAPWSDS